MTNETKLLLSCGVAAIAGFFIGKSMTSTCSTETETSNFSSAQGYVGLDHGVERKCRYIKKLIATHEASPKQKMWYRDNCMKRTLKA